MAIKLYRAEERGRADYGWLKANYSFSFAGWYDPSKVHFGMLRVLNDDYIAGGMGFDTHPHDNMEIVTIPLEGALAHKDSTGGEGVIHANEIQVMSAGTGVFHSEFNASETEPAKLFQIWVFPEKRNVTPRYDQKSFNPNDWKDKFHTLVGPKDSNAPLWVHQQCYFVRATISKGNSLQYDVKIKGNGVYVMTINGKLFCNEQLLNKRDALGISEVKELTFKAEEDSEVLLIEVPMN